MNGNQRRYQLANILQEAGGLQEGVARKAAEATGVPEGEVYGVATFYHLLTNDAGDPVTGTAEYKVCAAEVRKLDSIREEDPFPGNYYAIDGPGLARERVNLSPDPGES